MIFVTIGAGTTYGFNRLIKEMDEIAGKTSEEIIMQIGCTEYEPINAQYYRFVEKTNIEKLYNNSRVIVCHSGIGSILTAMKFNKPTIIVPRRKKYNEHIDDHQLEIAREFGKDTHIKVVHDVAELFDSLANIQTDINFKCRNADKLVLMLRDYLNELETKK